MRINAGNVRVLVKIYSAFKPLAGRFLMRCQTCALWAVSLFIGGFLIPGFAAAQPESAPAIEVQTRGQVHEAFAQPFESTFGRSPAVPKQPPPIIAELPPEQRPPGDNVQWIGGYWAWDAERNDFTWISGTYRYAPPNRHYIAGRWTNADDGWHWVSGFWAPNDQADVPYAQMPPAPLETGPAPPPPDDNSAYVPGYWNYQDATFAWRPGYYAAQRLGRVWVSPRYVWTPAGYLFVSGYWDYPFDDRGTLFAPVWFNRPYWQTPGWYYRPAYAVVLGAALDSLFWRSGGHHYYFGNYYGSAYAGFGYRPWFAHRYDGLYNYHRWSQRGNGNWAADQQRLFHDRHIGRVDGPPRTLAQQHAGNRMVVPLHEARDRNVGISRSSLASGNQRGPTLAHVQTAHMPRVVNNTPTTAHTFASRSTPHVVHSSPATAHAHATSQVHHVAHAAPQHHATAHASHGGGHSSHGGGHSGGGGHHGHH